VVESARYARGEIWTLGRYYAAASASYELLPIVEVSVTAIANLADPSDLAVPAMKWSISDDAELVAGAFVAVGRRSEAVLGVSDAGSSGAVPIVPRSEFGLAPQGGYVGLKAYF
jgi:hypothetical protein